MNISGSSDSSINGEYYYIRNLQGDIIGLIDKSGAEVVSYSYDTWGKLISIEGSLKDTVGVKNPYRYRGYRYDTETGLYYLNARYYNPEWGRFINADSYTGDGGLLSHNLFSYCMNDPVNLQDPSGNIAISTLIMIGGLVAWGAGTIYSAVKQKQATGKVDWLYAVSYGASWGYTAMTLGLAAASLASMASSVPSNATGGSSGSTSLTGYNPQFAARQTLNGGKVSESSLKSLVPKGVPNTFKPSSTISDGYKYNFTANGTKMEVKWHSPDSFAATKFGNMSNSGSGWTAQIRVGGKLLGLDGNFYPRKNPSNLTHIPLIGGK
ncbi:RHS repeat-associated core domain-containing protein [Clostridium sp. C8]|uniref:RHS repeat-associated core domain-containing protein n=1 Tax=Clostridium sp. C8 TaxID=1667357 RepID=UPI00069C3005|nr:RHS repeat-associated core domain-containing protein [Clostridium sp. C8]